MSCEATRIYTSLSYRAKKVHDGSSNEFELIHTVLPPYYALRALKEAIYRMEWECELALNEILQRIYVTDHNKELEYYSLQTQYVLAEPISEPRAQRDDYCWKFRNHGAKDIVQHHLSPTNSIGAQLAILLALSFASIFRLAARIISSLRFCRAVCRSCLLADHPCFELVSSCEDVSEIFTFEERLYLLIKSIGAAGTFVTGLVCPLWAGVPIGIGGCGWNEGGGYGRYYVSRNFCQRSS